MEIAKIRVTQNTLELEQTGCVTAGMVGAFVTFESFDAEWDGLTKTVVFRNNRSKSRDAGAVVAGEPVIIPWEVLDDVGADLMVSVYGTNADGTLVIPTVWGDLGRIASGAKPAGRPAEPPTPDWTQQIEGQVNQAIEAAQAAGPLAQQAADHAKAAGDSANAAAGSASTAASNADAAASSASAAGTYAESARTSGNDAVRGAQQAGQMANEAKGAAGEAKAEADRAKREADRATETSGTLSVASAETLGGVKVGEGLTMVGEKMNADISAMKYRESVNIVNIATIGKQKGYLDKTGNLVDYQNSVVSDFLQVKPGEKMIFFSRAIGGISCYFCVYDKDKSFVAADYPSEPYGGWANKDGEYTFPADAAFIRCTMPTTSEEGRPFEFRIPETTAVRDELDYLGSQLGIWEGKKCIAFGTSITDTSYINAETGEPTGKYIPVLAELSGLDINNQGLAGGTIAKGGIHGGSANILERILATDVSGADLILIEGFVNDFAVANTIGKTSDVEETTFCGALYKAIRYCLENSKATVCLITESTGKVYTMSTGSTADYSVTKLNSLDLTQNDYNDAIVKMGEYMQVPVIDAGRISAINCFRPAYIIDQIHHTKMGGAQYAKAIWSVLQRIPTSEGGKNLWDLARRTILTAEDAGKNPDSFIAPGQGRIIPYNKYMIASYRGYWYFNTSQSPQIVVEKNNLAQTTKFGGVCICIPFTFEVGKKYHIKYNQDGVSGLYAVYYNADGVYVKYTELVPDAHPAGAIDLVFQKENYENCLLEFPTPLESGTVNYTGITIYEE